MRSFTQAQARPQISHSFTPILADQISGQGRALIDIGCAAETGGSCDAICARIFVFKAS